MRASLTTIGLCLMLLTPAITVRGEDNASEISIAFAKARKEVVNGEEIYCFQLPVVKCYSRPRDMSRYYRTIINVKKVYPLAKEAERLLAEIESRVDTMATNREQRAFIKRMEKELLAEYTPVLKEMTFSQGKILIKLLDRQTERTGFSIVKELRGGFRAGIYQGIGRIFGMNLKDTYDKDGEDRLIEEIIEMYEQGLL